MSDDVLFCFLACGGRHLPLGAAAVDALDLAAHLLIREGGTTTHSKKKTKRAILDCNHLKAAGHVHKHGCSKRRLRTDRLCKSSLCPSSRRTDSSSSASCEADAVCTSSSSCAANVACVLQKYREEIKPCLETFPMHTAHVGAWFGGFPDGYYNYYSAYR